MPEITVERITIEEVQTTLRQPTLASQLDQLTPVELRALADIVYSMLRAEMRVERERFRRNAPV